MAVELRRRSRWLADAKAELLASPRAARASVPVLAGLGLALKPSTISFNLLRCCLTCCNMPGVE